MLQTFQENTIQTVNSKLEELKEEIKSILENKDDGHADAPIEEGRPRSENGSKTNTFYHGGKYFFVPEHFDFPKETNLTEAPLESGNAHYWSFQSTQKGRSEGRSGEDARCHCPMTNEHKHAHRESPLMRRMNLPGRLVALRWMRR